MVKLWQLLKKIDDNLIKILLVFFIFFIPLWPKFPLKNVNFTYIAIRLDDVFVLLLFITFIIQLLRKKVNLNGRFFYLFCLFWIFVFLSYLSGLYLTKTVEFPQVGFLHTVRRFQYMMIFFIASSVIKKPQDFFLVLKALFLSLFLVNVYGLGQRFLGWPAVSTMNPEFARGHLLYLTPEARLASTFAGHYDLAAYLVFMIPLVWGAYFAFAQNRKKLIFLALFSLLILVYTASRISFIAYIISAPLFLLFLKKYRYFIIVLLISLGLTFFSRDLTKRFLKTLQVKQILVNEKTGEVYVPQKINSKDLPAGSLIVKIKEEPEKNNSESVSDQEKLKEKLIYEATKSGVIQASASATLSAQLKPVSAIAYDISFATRLQVEWPRAIKAFLKNPLLGTGPSSITESTDNDYLRWLGETGLIGAFLFLFIIFKLTYFVFQNLKKVKKQHHPLFYALFFSLFGLMINATYIDVFEASKVAYVFWYVMGIYIGFFSLKKNLIQSVSI